MAPPDGDAGSGEGPAGTGREDTRDHYEVMEVARDATPAQIRSAYLRLAAVQHPDRGGSPEEFMRLQKAYNILSNEDFKAAYDERLPKPGLASRPKEPQSQHGVVKGVHVRVHGQTGLTAEQREAEQQRKIRKAQAEQVVATDEEWLQHDAQEAVEQQQQGNKAFRTGDFEAAVKHYTSAVRLVAAQWDAQLPLDVANLYSNRAAAFACLGRYSRSLADAEVAIEHKPRWAKAHLRRGVACFYLMQYAEAIQALTRARDLAAESNDTKTVIAAEEHLELSKKEQAAAVENHGGETEATIAQVKAQMATTRVR